MGCAESCNAKDFEAKVNTVYLKYSNLVFNPLGDTKQNEIKLLIEETNSEDVVIETQLNDIAPTDRSKNYLLSDRISKEAVQKLTNRKKKPSLVLNADGLVKNVKRLLINDN